MPGNKYFQGTDAFKPFLFNIFWRSLLFCWHSNNGAWEVIGTSQRENEREHTILISKFAENGRDRAYACNAVPEFTASLSHPVLASVNTHQRLKTDSVIGHCLWQEASSGRKNRSRTVYSRFREMRKPEEKMRGKEHSIYPSIIWFIPQKYLRSA